ncbi:MAG: serine/threonine protein kinase, partial [Planctomycetota bacterium]
MSPSSRRKRIPAHSPWQVRRIDHVAVTHFESPQLQVATKAFRPRQESSRATSSARHDTQPSSGTAANVSSADLHRDDLTGFQISHYQLGRRIGSGGMGQVFEAKHSTLGKRFAIKFMTDDARLCNEGVHRFQQEITSLGVLRHPNIVSAVDAGNSGGLHYLVTELVDGTNLYQLVKDKESLSESKAIDMILQAARGLNHAHQLGFIHRDIKPSNLILDSYGTVRLLDFGLVLHQRRSDELTSPGQLLGTVDFLAPEQAADGRIADHRSDLYSLGCTLLYLLTGKTPFFGEQFNSIATKIHGHLFATPPAMQLLPVQTTDQTRQCLERLIAKRPDQRFQSCDELISALTDGASITRQSMQTDLQRTTRKPLSALAKISLFMCISSALLVMGFANGSKVQSPSNNKRTAPAVTATSGIQPAPASAESTLPGTNTTSHPPNSVVLPTPIPTLPRPTPAPSTEPTAEPNADK